MTETKDQIDPKQDVQDEMDEKDPGHHGEVFQALNEAFENLGVLGRILFILYALLMIILVYLPNRLLSLLRLRSNKSAFTLKGVATTPEVYMANYYTASGISNTILIKGHDKKLLIRSPPPPLPEIVERVTKQGDIGAILVSLTHDTYAAEWKKLFPDAVVVGQAKDIPALNQRVQVDVALEDATDLLKNYFVLKVMPMSRFLRYEDATLLIDLPDSKIAACLGCGFSNDPFSIYEPTTWQGLITGVSLRMHRSFGFIFVKDHRALRKFWQEELAGVKCLSTLIFLHGEPVIGTHVPELLSKSDPCPEFDFIM